MAAQNNARNLLLQFSHEVVGPRASLTFFRIGCFVNIIFMFDPLAGMINQILALMFFKWCTLGFYNKYVQRVISSSEPVSKNGWWFFLSRCQLSTWSLKKDPGGPGPQRLMPGPKEAQKRWLGPQVAFHGKSTKKEGFFTNNYLVPVTTADIHNKQFHIKQNVLLN